MKNIKNVKRIFAILILVIMLIYIMPVKSYAAVCPTCDGTGILPNTQNESCPNCHGTGNVISKEPERNGRIDTSLYDPSINNPLKPEDYQEAFQKGKTIVIVLQAIGIVVAVAGAIMLGLKYMMGSLEERADYKKTMIPYIVGCVMIAASTTLISIIYNRN